MALKLYVETSVWNGVLKDNQPRIQTQTLDFFGCVSKRGIALYVSPVVRAEIAGAPHPIRERLEQMLEEWQPFYIHDDPEISAFADVLVERGIDTSEV